MKLVQPVGPGIAAAPAGPFPRIHSLVLAGGALVVIFIAGFGAWSFLAPLENAALAQGVVEVESKRKTVQHLEGGILRKILVRDGEEVPAGQVLIRLDDTKARTSLLALEGQFWDGLAQQARLVAERDGATAISFPSTLTARSDEPAIAAVLAGQRTIFETRRTLLDSKAALIRQRIAQVREEIVGLEAQEGATGKGIAFIEEEIVGLRQLVAKGLERKPRLLQLDRELAETQGRRGDLVAQIARAKQSIIESEISILNLRNDTQKEVAEQLRQTEQNIHGLQEQIQAASDVLARTEVRAPESGTVTDLRVHTPGGVINAGEPLLDLVPKEDSMIVTAQVRPEDIDRVHVGLPAQVRLLPYKQRRTPPLDAAVTYVSADRLTDDKTSQPYYSARLRVSSRMLADLPEVEMVPGMPAEIMIKTGETTVALYALAPILDSFHRAFHEK
jgi:HlyD family secretion protein